MLRAVICQKQISFEGNGHCCHRPSSNWETKPTRAVICQKQISVEGDGHCCHRPSSKLGNQTKQYIESKGLLLLANQHENKLAFIISIFLSTRIDPSLTT